MSAFLAEYGLFLAKSVTLLIAVLLLVAGVAAVVRSGRGAPDGHRLEVQDLGEQLQASADAVRRQALGDDEYKRWRKQHKAETKARRKQEQAPGADPRSCVYVLDFDGDLQAHAVASLREEITAVLQVARPRDEVLLRLESPGGVVHAYGLAASQLVRVRRAGLRLTVAVDKVAASGGYLMACVADRILAAPFAVVGSIGVVAQLPNFNRLLRKNEIDIELHTAGEYKRTLTLFGENSEAGRAKFREELQDTHDLFKSFVAEHRPALDLDRAANGEHWFGTRALALKLVDELRTSDDYLLERAGQARVLRVRYRLRKRLAERLGLGLATLAGAFGRRALQPPAP